MPPTRVLLRWLPALAWMGVISYWSSQSVLPIDAVPGWKDPLHKLSHLGAFGLLAVLFLWAVGPDTLRAPLLAWLLTAAFGVVDEWHQTFTPGRMGQVSDWLIDALAAALGAPLARWAWRARAGLATAARAAAPPDARQRA